MSYIIGIDEAGRGPLAGPVSVGVFGAEKRIEKWLLKNIFDTPANIESKLAGISYQTQPKSRWLSFAQKRLGRDSEIDAVECSPTYMPAPRPPWEAFSSPKEHVFELNVTR